MDQELEDSFLMITSTKTDLDSISFLSSLDMDPQLTGYAFGGGSAGGGLISPAASRVILPLGSGTATEGLFHSLSASTQGSSGAVATTNASDSTGTMGETKREVFSDFRRFVSFGLRKDTTGLS